MTLSPEQALYDRILDFVSSETSTRKQNLSGNTDIASDLGVDGDDAVEFMLKFKRDFDVDLSNFVFDRYFVEEGLMFIPFKKSLLGKGKVRNPLTIAVLFDAANSHHWPESAVGEP